MLVAQYKPHNNPILYVTEEAMNLAYLVSDK